MLSADQLHQLYARSQDELAEQTLKAMCRKFSGSAKIWLRNISWLLSKDRAEAARKALDRSFTALPQRKHIKVITSMYIYFGVDDRMHTFCSLRYKGNQDASNRQTNQACLRQ